MSDVSPPIVIGPPPAGPAFEDPRRSRAFALLFACVMVTGVGNSILFAVLPPLARTAALNDLSVGVIYTVSAILFSVMAPVWGRASDRLGRRPIIVLGLGGYAVSMALFSSVVSMGLAQVLSGAGLLVALVAARSIFGALGSAATPAANAWVADRAAPHARTAALAALGAAFGLGGVVGPALASIAAPYAGLVTPLYVVAALAVAAAVLVALRLPEKTRPVGQLVRPSGGLKLLVDPRLRAVVAIGVLSWTVQGAILQTVTFLLMDRLGVEGARAAEYAGLALMSGAIATLTAQLGFVGVFKPTPRAAMGWGAVVTLAGSLILAIAPTLGAITVGFAVASFGMGLERSGVSGAASLAVEPHEQGSAAGVASATAGLGFLFAPIIGLAVRGAYGPSAPYLACAALLLVSLLIVARARSLRLVITEPA